jgi:ferredoxin
VPAFARTRASDRVLSGEGSLLRQCRDAGLPLASSCDGRGGCGRCMVSLLAGQSTLTPMGVHERRVLRRLGAAEGVRLACQCGLGGGGEPVVLTTGYW